MDFLNETFDLIYQYDNKIIFTIIVFIAIAFFRWGVNKFIIDKLNGITKKYKWRKITTYLSFVIGVILILPIWFEISRFVTFIGLSTAGLAIAFRDLLTSLLGWGFIIWKRPFNIGDRIQIGETAGDVIDIRIFQFSLIEIGRWVDADQSTGRVVHVPNKKVLTTDVANYTADFSFIWNEMPVLITFESEWKKAKNILLEIVQEVTKEKVEDARREISYASRKYMIYYSKLTPIIYTKVKESGILLSIRYLCKPQSRRTSEGMIWEKILEKFANEPNINFAYPTQRLYFKENGIQGETDETNFRDKIDVESDTEVSNNIKGKLNKEDGDNS